MAIAIDDVRLRAPGWQPRPPTRAQRVRVVALGLCSTLGVLVYFHWLLRPDRVGNPLLFGLLAVAELFNALQAIGFWWTCALSWRRRTSDRRLAPPGRLPTVDVLIPTYSEPVEIVEATVAAAVGLRGARVRVALLDDGDRQEMERLAARYGARYVRREQHTGAKAGNINHALASTDGDFVLVLDCDHVPRPELLVRTLPALADRQVAFVQTPQHYANADSGPIAAAAWSQQALFFGPIACGKATHDAMFCCGTNVVFRRAALESVGGFPETSLTEDFELSLTLHERGWRSVYVPEVLASGLGPEDLASYVSQQHRWARGCVGAIPRVLRSGLPLRQRVQYLLSASYFLSGWTVMLYLALPAIRIVTGAQPIAGAGADSFLAHFAPYFGFALATVASVGSGTYTFAAYSLATSTFWVHVHASSRALLRRSGSFVVTPKQGDASRQLRSAAPTAIVVALLTAAAVFGLARSRDPATLNNVAFALLHITVLTHGVWPALAPATAASRARITDGSVDEAAA